MPSPTIQIQNHALVVFRYADDKVIRDLFESYEISKLLGYAQYGSLRKQTLTDWIEVLDAEKDYWMIHEESVIRKYEREYKEAGNGELTPVRPKRGRLFFTPRGLLKVLNRTTKPSEELRAAVMHAGHFKGLDIQMVVKDKALQDKIAFGKEFIAGTPCRRCERPLDRSQDCPCTPAPKIVAKPKRVTANTVPVATAPRSRDERMFEYEVMQKLIRQLQSSSLAPPLRALAITAAETALGRELSDLRLGEAVQTIFKAAPPQQPTEAPSGAITTDGPIFTADDYYSMTRIGEKAGGYSARQAGLAANIVASARGWTPAQIRSEKMSINQIAMRPDSTSGKERPMVRFHTDFANYVVVELRENPKFSPSLARGVPTLSFAEDLPLLSRGPFE